MNAPVSGQERQRHLRIATLLMGQVAADSLRCSCEILNISVGGARLRLGEDAGALEQVTIQVEGYPNLDGRVVWRAAREIGVEFDYESRETAARLQAEVTPAQMPNERRRTIRISVLWSGRLHLDDTDMPCMVLNISGEGARLRISTPLEDADGQPVRLQVDRLGVLDGRIAWGQDDEVAIAFTEDADRVVDMLSAVLPRAQFSLLNGQSDEAEQAAAEV